jgi:hypothetical protein
MSRTGCLHQGRESVCERASVRTRVCARTGSAGARLEVLGRVARSAPAIAGHPVVCYPPSHEDPHQAVDGKEACQQGPDEPWPGHPGIPLGTLAPACPK